MGILKLLEKAEIKLDSQVFGAAGTQLDIKVLVWLWHPEIRKQMFQAFLLWMGSP